MGWIKRLNEWQYEAIRRPGPPRPRWARKMYIHLMLVCAVGLGITAVVASIIAMTKGLWWRSMLFFPMAGLACFYLSCADGLNDRTTTPDDLNRHLPGGQSLPERPPK